MTKAEKIRQLLDSRESRCGFLAAIAADTAVNMALRLNALKLLMTASGDFTEAALLAAGGEVEQKTINVNFVFTDPVSGEVKPVEDLNK